MGTKVGPRRIIHMYRQEGRDCAGNPCWGDARVSVHGTMIPKCGQAGGIRPEAVCCKTLTNRGFRRILLGKGVAPSKGDNDYGHTKTI
jgi:hypothetical protein